MHKIDTVAAEILVNELGLLVLEAIDDGANTETVFAAIASLVETTVRLCDDDEWDTVRAQFVQSLLIMSKVSP